MSMSTERCGDVIGTRARMAAAAIIGAALVGGIGQRPCGGPSAPRDRGAASCLDPYAAERWLEASVACARQAERTGDPAPGVRAAGALLRLDRSEQAVASARRWFGSSEDATARQIAGVGYLELDDLAAAIAMLEAALAGHRGLADHLEASRDAGNLAGALLQAGRLGDAVEAAEGAVREADLAPPGDAHARLRGRARLKVGKLMTEIGDFSTARTMLWEAQQALARWPVDQAWVFLQLGELLQAVDDPASAATLLERTLELAAGAGVPPVVVAARLNLAYVRRDLGQLDAAERELGALDDEVRAQPMALFIAGLVQADRGRLGVAEDLLARAAAGAPTDDYAMDIALHRGRLAERGADLARAEQFYRTAIELVEKLRARTDSLELRPLILARRREPYRALVALLARQRREGDALVVAEQLHARSWLDALVGHTGERGARAEVRSALALGRRLHGGAAAPPTLDGLRAVMRGREILMFAEADRDLWRFYLVDGAIVELALVPDRVQAVLARWRKTPHDPALAAELGELLIPAAARAASPRPLYLVTNGALDTLPFAALRTRGRFLVEDRVISRLPGIAALRCPAPHQVRPASVFLGDSRRDLAAARGETTALAALVGGVALVGDDATVEQLEAARDAQLLHLALHADVGRSGARLLLANQRQVTVAEIVEHAVGPRVAVLAGCATAVGRDAESWGALSSAFLAAGSRSVVATLGSVNDAETAEMMRRFYRQGGERQPAVALARAQRELIDREPAMWSAFVVYGSADPTDCSRD